MDFLDLLDTVSEWVEERGRLSRIAIGLFLLAVGVLLIIIGFSIGESGNLNLYLLIFSPVPIIAGLALVERGVFGQKD